MIRGHSDGGSLPGKAPASRKGWSLLHHMRSGKAFRLIQLAQSAELIKPTSFI